MFLNLIKGILIGLMFGVPIGAVGTLTLSHTLSGGRKAGLLTGLGSSAADCIYAVIGVFGLTFLSDFLQKYSAPITAVGGVFVLFLGVNALYKKPNENKSTDNKQDNLLKTFLSSFFIGITNPAAILTFLIAFNFFDIGKAGNVLEGLSLVAGVLCGTFIWWIVLTELALFLKKRNKNNRLQFINKILGCLLILFAVIIFAKLIWEAIM